MRSQTSPFACGDLDRSSVERFAGPNAMRVLGVGVVILACLVMDAAAWQGAPGQSSTPPASNAVPGSPGKTTPEVAATTKYTDDQLKLLVGPVALYPDALLANTLTACLYPDEVAAAARMCVAGSPPTQAQIDATNWELPVKAIAAVPTVVNMLSQHPDWMRALGAAYLKQPSDVMRVTQQLRARAIANGALKSDDQLTVTQSSGDGGNSTVTIVSTNSQLIAVPLYSPDVVYADPDVYIAGYPVGYWGYADGVYVGPSFGVIDCDWYGGYCVWDQTVYNPNWEHVGIAGVNTLHNDWNNRQRFQNVSVASALKSNAVGSALRGVGQVGSPYRPAGSNGVGPVDGAGGVGDVRMPAASQIPGGGRLAGLNGLDADRPSWGAGGAGAFGRFGDDSGGGDNSAFAGDRRSSAASQRGASSDERSFSRGGEGGGRR
ncbi:MAG: DUF3300 domain-containing protein [Planctomycetes bacterium]|nr:DUF3300 domain-containing protein [Planctomycetota bacterium]